MSTQDTPLSALSWIRKFHFGWTDAEVRQAEIDEAPEAAPVVPEDHPTTTYSAKLLFELWHLQDYGDYRAQAAIAAQAQQAQGVPSRDDAIRVWRKHCRPFVAQLGNAPPSCVIDAMMELATAPQADHIADASKLVGQAQGVPEAAEYRRGWDECMKLWADHMKRMNEALNAPSKVGYANRAAELYHNVKAAVDAAPQAEPCDAGELCIGCSPRNADGSCPAAAPQAEPQIGEKALTEALEERDAASDYIDTLLDEVLGADRPEWTSNYGHADAMDDVRQRMADLQASATQAEPQPEREPIPDGEKVIDALRAAMDKASVPHDFRASLIGYFCNGWNEIIRRAAPQAEPQTPAPAHHAELDYDAWECPDCGGAGRRTVYHSVTHQLGTDDLPFWEACETCDGTGYCGPDAEKLAALSKPPAQHTDAAPQAEPQPEREPLSRAALDVLTERQRQISVEGWTAAHDDEHSHGEMAKAASAYAWGASYPTILGAGNPPDWWPWDAEWWKPSTPRRNLIKAGAIILAEIERLDRAGGGA